MPADPAASLYRQVYWRFRHAIEEGTLKPGERLPSVRALAKELGLARGTVEEAYAMLSGEGWTQARGQAGTFVSPDLPLRAPGAGVADVPAILADVEPAAAPLPFQMGLPAIDAFPRKLWARLGAGCLRGMRAYDLVQPPLHGLPALRAAIAAYLQVARGVRCGPGQVFVTTGYRGTLRLIAQALLQSGDEVWVEDPGYPLTRELLRQSGLRPACVPVDGEGLVVARGIETAGSARAAVLTPAHQSPMCVTLSPARRLALLEWAARQDAWLVEDDYDGEYRYASRPLPALASLDRRGRVLYAGTFSKVLFPGLRLAYLVVPAPQAGRFEAAQSALADGAAWITQSMLAAFMSEGHFSRHIQRMRRLYAERRAQAAAAFGRALEGRARIEPQPGGMHLVLRMDAGDVELAGRMAAAGLYGQALSRWSSRADAPQGLLLGFTNIATPAQAEQLAERVRALL